MKNPLIYIISLLILFPSCTNTAKTVAQSMEHEISEIENNLLPNIKIKGTVKEKYNLLERMKYHNTPGVSITIVKNGKVHWSKGYGLLNVNKTDKVNTNSLFQVASSTKPITALGSQVLEGLRAQKLEETLKEWSKL